VQSAPHAKVPPSAEQVGVTCFTLKALRVTGSIAIIKATVSLETSFSIVLPMMVLSFAALAGSFAHLATSFAAGNWLQNNSSAIPAMHVRPSALWHDLGWYR
jgi:hypothetical protein